MVSFQTLELCKLKRAEQMATVAVEHARVRYTLHGWHSQRDPLLICAPPPLEGVDKRNLDWTSRTKSALFFFLEDFFFLESGDAILKTFIHCCGVQRRLWLLLCFSVDMSLLRCGRLSIGRVVGGTVHRRTNKVTVRVYYCKHNDVPNLYTPDLLPLQSLYSINFEFPA